MRFTDAGVRNNDDRSAIGDTLAEDPEDCALVEPLSSDKRPLPAVDMT